MDYSVEEFLEHFQQRLEAIATRFPAFCERNRKGLGDWFALAHSDPDAALAADNVDQVAMRLVWLLFLVDLYRLKQRVAPEEGRKSMDILSFALSDLIRLVGSVDPQRGACLEAATYNVRRLLRDRFRQLSAGSAQGSTEQEAGIPGG